MNQNSKMITNFTALKEKSAWKNVESMKKSISYRNMKKSISYRNKELNS